MVQSRLVKLADDILKFNLPFTYEHLQLFSCLFITTKQVIKEKYYMKKTRHDIKYLFWNYLQHRARMKHTKVNVMIRH